MPRTVATAAQQNRHMRRVTTTLLATLSMAAALSAVAQQGAAEIRGWVLDAQQRLLPDATVVLRNQETGMFRRVASTADGTYFLSGVMPGVYELSAELAGFKRYSRRGVRLEVGRTASRLLSHRILRRRERR